MKILKISRENLIKEKFYNAKEIESEKNENITMDKELGDFLFKLLQSVNTKKDGNGLGFIMSSSFKMDMCLNFIVRKETVESIKEQITSLYRSNIGRVRQFYNITAMNLVVLDEGEEYLPTDTNENVTNLSYLKGVA